MEERKQKEIDYYDRQIEKNKGKENADFEGFSPLVLGSFRFFYSLIKKYAPQKMVLDYGCGNGIHSHVPLEAGAKEVIGIDLSERSLEIAKEQVRGVKFLAMDCEKTEFADNYFDIIIDGGTFSSLDINVVYPELKRILKPKGMVVGIETFGHNPIANLKRKINKATGKRTEWAEGHIFQQKDLSEAKNYFNKVNIYYFHIISFLAIPFLKFPGGGLVLKILEVLDRGLFLLPFLRKYAFKVVFIFSEPKK